MEAFFILKYWHFLIAKIWHFKVADYNLPSHLFFSVGFRLLTTLEASNSSSHSHVCGNQIRTISNTGGVEFQ
jgi:hypothetical protein